MNGYTNNQIEKNVGILGIEIYSPSTYITQASLEEHSKVPAGKYTIGLGQTALGITGDAEDVNSIALTVVHSLLEKYDIDPSEVGRLEVGTETLVDKSKSTKTVLMQLFPNNTDIEGATIVNACYGGTAALLNAFAWVESDGWDGRYAIVVAADIAAYARGPARPTCGVGAVAVLVGRDAPLGFDPKERVTHAAHVWDYFKPDHTVEYPTVDGALSQTCYYKALEDCYERFCAKLEKLSPSQPSHQGKEFTATSPDYFVFHAPYNKLVQKSYARLFLMDEKRKYAKLLARRPSAVSDADTSSVDENKKEPEEEEVDPRPAQQLLLSSPLAKWIVKSKSEEEWAETYVDRELDSTLNKMASAAFTEKLLDANHVSKHVGNTYTASVFLGLASLVSRVGSRNELQHGKSICVFSYGSGALASLYRLTVRDTPDQQFTVDKMVTSLNMAERLETRECVHPAELDYALETRARMHCAGAPYQPIYPTVGRLWPGTYFLAGIDEHWKRTYARVPLDDERKLPSEVGQYQPLAPPEAVRLANQEEQNLEEAKDEKATLSIVITGVSAGLPGLGRQVFAEDNLERLVRGEQCIDPVPEDVKQAMVEKHVVRVKKLPDGTLQKVRIESADKVIQLAAQLSAVDLSGRYGVPPGLAETMDVAAQVAVAAGLEALKSAGLVSGRTNEPSEWKLAERHRDSTGVVYASSFPAMDAAVGEVMRFLKSQTIGNASAANLIKALRSRMIENSHDSVLSADDEAALARMEALTVENPSRSRDEYEFDRKFLFRVLVLGNAQLAQLAGCRGPNAQTNAACAGTTQAIAMAEDILVAGRAERVVVVAGDNGSGSTLLPWLGSGFCALGAATTAAAVEDAALPFDKRRSGMLLGAGGIGMVLETEKSAKERLSSAAHAGSACGPIEIKARLLASQYSNSAYHGAALDRKHIASELKRFLADVENKYGITKDDIASNGVYFSHETCTHASSSSSCAGNEIGALREAFGDELLSKLLILNTKGFTGHPMGVSFEDVAAVEVLMRQVVPPIANYKVKDDYLGDINLSKGGYYACQYALRFAAGFGSQVAFALYGSAKDQ